MPTDTWNSDSRSRRAERQLRAWPRRRTAGSARDRPLSRQRELAACAAMHHARDQLQGLRGVEAAGDALACAPRARRAARRRRRSARAASRSATGSMAGARSPRGNSRPTACMAASAGVRGAKVKRIERRACARQGGERARPHRRRVVVDQRVHGDHVVEAAERRVEHVADAEVDAARAQVCRRALARQLDQRRRQVDGDDVRAAPRRLDRERPVPQPASSTRAPRRSAGSQRQQRGAHRGRGPRAPWRGCGRPARRR